MAILGYEWADFVVWTPKKCVIKRVMFEPDYWLVRTLLPLCAPCLINLIWQLACR